MVKACNGKPAKYSEELASEICETIISSELGLMHLCNENPHWPHRAQIFKWIAKYPEFGDKYRKAKEQQTQICFEYMHELMNEPHVFIDPETGIHEVDSSLLRLKLDHFKWHVAKLKPKEFGDTKQLEITNSDIADDSKRRLQQQLDEKNKKPF
jgi:hypothetical protein